MGGLVGSLGYDYIRYTEKLPDDNPDEIGIETIQLMLASRFIAIDHEAETFTAVVLDEDNEAGRKRAMEEAEQLSDRIAIMVSGKLRAVGTLSELEALTGEKGLENAFIKIAESSEGGEAV